jgi:thiol-disulfide isomerase/thioredoxin
MNRSHIVAVGSVALLMLGMSACTPNKEDKPPKPKVTANAAEPKTEAAAPVASSPLAALPKLGTAPKWELKDLDGKVVRSEQFKGKVVIVDFWATWCPPCRAEIPGYIELQKKYGADGLAIVGVSIDQGGPDVVKQFAQKFGVNYQLVMGDDNAIAAFGGFDGIPTTFLIDRNGQVRDRKEGAEETAVYEKKIASVLKETAGQ